MLVYPPPCVLSQRNKIWNDNTTSISISNTTIMIVIYPNNSQQSNRYRYNASRCMLYWSGPGSYRYNASRCMLYWSGPGSYRYDASPCMLYWSGPGSTVITRTPACYIDLAPDNLVAVKILFFQLSCKSITSVGWSEIIVNCVQLKTNI